MAFQSFLRRLGAPVDRYLRHNGLPALCEDPDVFVPVVRVWKFFDDEAFAEHPLLGWHVGEFVGDHMLNADLLQKLERSSTLLGAVRTLCSLVRAEGTHVDIGILERREDILFYTHYWGHSDMRGYHVSQAYQLGVFLDLVRFFAGRDWMPTELGLEAATMPPGLEDRLPGIRVLLCQPFGYVAIPRKFLCSAARKQSSNGGELHDPIEKGSLDYIEKLRDVVKAYLSEGYVSEKIAAGLMDTSVRSLTRTLAAQGISYGKLVDDVRFETAKERLGNFDARIIEVAHSIGFKDQANFTRMFRRISGITPGQFRRLLISEGTELGPPLAGI